MKSLDDIAIEHGTDKATKHPIVAGHGYTHNYEMIFDKIRKQPIKFLEIGVGGGESIRMWLEYFPMAKVYGMDNVHGTNKWNNSEESPNDRYSFFCGDQADQEMWSRFLSTHGGDWDVIVDDGGHYANQVITSFNCMWPMVKSGGYYCIEDLNVSYPDLWGNYGDVFVKPPWISHMDFIKGKLDEINRGNEICSLHFFKELAIIRKA